MQGGLSLIKHKGMHRLRMACALGTGFEFFEFQLFALFMPIWVNHFFSPTMPLSSRYLVGYLLFSVAFLARLLGALGLGFLADHWGRRVVLFIAMWLMAISTALIACLPDYAQAGYCGLLCLLLCRLGQGISLGGEFAIGAVLLYENQARPTCFALIWQDLGGCGGLFFATLLVTILHALFMPSQIAGYAWRYPFFIAFLISLWVIEMRRSISDPALQQGLLACNEQRGLSQYYHAVSMHWRVIGLLMLSCAPNGVFWYLQVVYVAHQLLPLPPVIMLALIGLTGLVIPSGAACADRYGLYRTWACSIVALVINFNSLVLSAQPVLQYLGLVIQAILLAFNQGPRLLIMTSHFPLPVRALGCSLVYSGANILGGLAPFASLWLLHVTHDNQALALVLVVVGGLAVSAMYCLARQQLSQTNAFGESEGVG